MDILSQLRQQWLGLLVGLAGVVLAVYFYTQSREEREPVFVVDPNRIELVSAEGIGNSPIKVLRRDNTPIQGDVYAVRFFFWNAGKRPIKSGDVLEPIQIAFRDSSAEILDFKPSKVSRPVTHLQLSRSPADARALLLTFAILERNDGLAGQIIYQGRRTTPVQIIGTIEQAKINTAAAPWWATIGAAVLFIGGLFLGATLPLALLGRLIDKSGVAPRVRELFNRHPRAKKAIPVLLGVIGISVLLGVVALGMREQQATDVVNFVPSNLVK